MKIRLIGIVWTMVIVVVLVIAIAYMIKEPVSAAEYVKTTLGTTGYAIGQFSKFVGALLP